MKFSEPHDFNFLCCLWMFGLPTKCFSNNFYGSVSRGSTYINISVQLAEHYEQVIATDISKAQLKCAMQHPRIRYIHTPLSLSNDELMNLIGDEGSVDLITVAQAIHWFDLTPL